jgi:hypothetical protein
VYERRVSDLPWSVDRGRSGLAFRVSGAGSPPTLLRWVGAGLQAWNAFLYPGETGVHKTKLGGRARHLFSTLELPPMTYLRFLVSAFWIAVLFLVLFTIVFLIWPSRVVVFPASETVVVEPISRVERPKPPQTPPSATKTEEPWAPPLGIGNDASDPLLRMPSRNHLINGYNADVIAAVRQRSDIMDQIRAWRKAKQLAASGGR